MAGKIFISYRRDDDASAAARVSDGLALRFGKANLFIDVDNLFAGQRFDEELAKALSACDVLIAVIGQRWMDLLKAKITSGERDYVREEIAAALQRRIVVVPARVGREGQLPGLPRAEDLPADIRDLVLYQKQDVTYERFGRDIGELIEAITVVRRSKRPEHPVPRAPWGWVGAMSAGVLAITYFGAYYLGVPVPWPGSPAFTNPNPSQITNHPGREPRAEGQAARRDPALSVTPGSGQSFRDQLASGEPCAACPEMVVVPAGSFVMGSPDDELGRGRNEGPQHKVTFAHRFAVGRFSVTFDEWDACVADGGCNRYLPSDQGWGRGRRPVINVSWNDVKTYLAWLSDKTGRTYRLPSEAEREYVARAGTTTPFWWGSTISATQANYKGIETYGNDGVRGEFRNQSVPVDTFAPNPWGLYQMHGNVSEWTEDCSHDNYVDAPTDGSAWTAPNCNQRVRRGGSIGSPPSVLRAASRRSTPPAAAQPFLGFRVVRDLAP
jgi:formylglycine-generating enzyme required for sulfatase activity